MNSQVMYPNWFAQWWWEVVMPWLALGLLVLVVGMFGLWAFAWAWDKWKGRK